MDGQAVWVVVLVLKGSHQRTLKDYRAISLICTEFKINSKVLHNCLKCVVDRVVSPSQFGLPGRSMLMGHGFLLDFVAHDTLEREALGYILLNQSFGEEIVGWVNKLHAHACVLVQVNGHLGKVVAVGLGLWQGCPVSQLLFACVQQPFHRLVEAKIHRDRDGAGCA